MDKWPTAVVIPKTQPDTQALKRMIWTLQHGQVEIREATAPVTVDGKSYPAGSYVVLTEAAVRQLRQDAARAAALSRSVRVSRRTAAASVRRHRAHAAAAVRRRRRARDGRAARDRPGPQGDPRADVLVGAQRQDDEARRDLPPDAPTSRSTTAGRRSSSTPTRFRTRRSRRKTSPPARRTTSTT